MIKKTEKYEFCNKDSIIIKYTFYESEELNREVITYLLGMQIKSPVNSKIAGLLCFFSLYFTAEEEGFEPP
ncbi:MAG TPA: hypothetical protein DDZ78_06945, partial [Porphyromonadaceae bacterium]|nr:hypothetical protein [Porphyromonadaceae bacterium]